MPSFALSVPVAVKRFAVFLAVLATGFVSGSTPQACDTPVYRYAMYHWMPEPYRVFYVYRGQPASQDAEVNRVLQEEAGGDRPGANVVFQAVDVAQKDQADQLPEAARKAWPAQGKDQPSTHWVFAPWGAEVSAQRLDAAAARTMFTSPLRQRVGEMLQQGHAAVLLLIPGKNPAENQRAESVAQEIAQRTAQAAAAAEAAARQTPAKPEGGPDGMEQEPAAPTAEKVKIGWVKLDRSDPAEQWPIRCIAAADREFDKERDEPRIYAIYGRGRLLPPFVGKEISADNLEELVGFLAGGCSCTVKDQSPGLDTLMRWDWEATAEALASRDPSSPQSPDVLEAKPDAAAPAKAEVKKEPPAPPKVDAGTAKAEDPPASAPAGQDEPEAEILSGRQLTTGAAEPPAPAWPRASPTAPAEPKEESFARRQIGTFAVGFAVVAAIVLLTGVVLLRRGRG